MKNKKSKSIVNGATPLPIWFIIFGVPIGYFWWNFGKYNGPGFLDDEIGYLANAIFLSGRQVDGGSSYHAGFSLVLTPLFLLFDDTFKIWQGVIFINSCCWGVTFYALNRLIVSWDDKVLVARRAIVLLLTSLYPTWLTMSGYAFTTSIFVALFMVGSLLFINALRAGGRRIYFFTICVGGLYWIHPIGLTAVGVSIGAMVVWAFYDRKLLSVCLFHVTGTVALVALYKYAVHPALLAAMTPEGYSPLTHYPDILDIFEKLKLAKFWAHVGVNALGQFSYFLVGTFGVALFGIYSIIRNIIKGSRHGWRMYAGGYFVGALAGVILLGAVNFALLEPVDKQIDDWMYGRYLDCVCMPILAISLLSYMHAGWQRRINLTPLCLLVVVLGGCIFYAIDDGYFLGKYNTISNVAAFWPQYIFPEVRELGFLMLVGAMGILLVYISGVASFYLLAGAIFVMGAAFQADFHNKMLTASSAKPTAILDLIRENYAPGAYISFDWDSLEGKSPFHKQRMILYKFYFHNYHYRRVSKAGWGADYSDIILTYDPVKYGDIGVEVAREARSSLYLLKKKSDYGIAIPDKVPTYGIVVKDNSNGPVAERLTCYAQEFIKMSEVGEFVGEHLVSNSKSGYLFFGPYVNLDRGGYRLTIHGEFNEIPSATLDIVASSGELLFFESSLSDLDGSSEERSLEFHLPQDISNLEVRLRVTDRDRVVFDNYVIEKVKLNSKLF